MQAISGSGQQGLEDSLDEFVSQIINAKVTINMMNREIRVPRLFDLYKSDFGNDSESVLSFIYKYL